MILFIAISVFMRVFTPGFVRDTLLLADGWYYEGDKLIGTNGNLKELRMPYYNGDVVIKTYIGDIIDF